MSDTWKHPKTGKEYPIETVTDKGRAVTNSELLKFLKDGKYNLLKGSNYLYNLETKRVIPKKKFVNIKNMVRPRFTAEGWILDDKFSNVIKKVKEEHTLKAIFTKHNEENDDKYYKDAVPFNMPNKTEQAKINSDKKKLDMKLMKMKEQGRVIVEGDEDEMIKEMENFPKHVHICYVTKENQYRCGGFLRKLVNNEKEQYFVLFVPDKRLSFPVQFKNVKSLYIKAIQRKGVEITPTDKPETKFPVKLGDIVVYYAKDAYDRRRFMTTEKFKNMEKHFNDQQAVKQEDD
jgi:hypothetical protein